MLLACLHCQSPVSGDGARFCCQGCEAAHALIGELGLDKYYELRGTAGLAVERAITLSPAIASAAERLAASTRAREHLSFAVAGLHCAACVWVIERIFERSAGALAIRVFPFAGRVELDVAPGFDLSSFARQLLALGYRLGTAPREDDRELRGLLVRLGVCAAGTMNVMALALPAYFGLRDGAVRLVMERSSILLTALVVVVGGTPFFRGALSSLRARALHLDVPIALGILFAFGGSLLAWALGHTADTYFDSVASFATLMVAGRWLQGRVLAANRRVLLADPGIDALPALVVEGGTVGERPVGSLEIGTQILVRPGDLVPVDAQIVSAPCAVRRDFLSGEATETRLLVGDRVEAGSVLASAQAVVLETIATAQLSRFAALLRSPPAIAEDAALRGRGWARLSRIYIVATLGLAFGSAAAFWLLAHDPTRALTTLVAVLVVACPCAFGIAIPVGYEATLAALRRAGVFVRSPGLLDRAAKITDLVFDKTGTLTLGELEIVPSSCGDLAIGDRIALWNLAVRSAHPKARAVVALLADAAVLRPDAQVEERVGEGLEGTFAGRRYRLGSPSFTGHAERGGDLVATRDGVVIAALQTRERFRDDAPAALSALASVGYDLHLLSGDDTARVRALGRRLGFADDRVRGEVSPEAKAAYVAALPGAAMMIGDGINDIAAMAVASASVTPAGDQPFVASRADCYVRGALGPGLALLLARGKHLRAIVREAVIFGVAYNVVAIATAVSGHVSPLGAAIVMPASSLFIVLWVAGRVRRFSARAEAASHPISCPVPLPSAGPAVALSSRGVL